MPTVYVYVVAASTDPDNVTCAVPYGVDDDLIFFGPCKKRLREALRATYLAPGVERAQIDDDTYIVGVNGSNSRHVRKVLWAGRLSEVMTFAYAYRALSGPRFEKMRTWEYSPTHVRPVEEQERLVGYEHLNLMHASGDGWITDLVSSAGSPAVIHAGNRLLLRAGISPWTGFDRDACLLLDNLFFARGSGLPIDAVAVDILKRAQGRTDIDSFAVFGKRKDGSAEGLTGRYLTMRDSAADELVRWIRTSAGRIHT
jgi:hypothetical protein